MEKTEILCICPDISYRNNFAKHFSKYNTRLYQFNAVQIQGCNNKDQDYYFINPRANCVNLLTQERIISEFSLSYSIRFISAEEFFNQLTINQLYPIH